MLRALFQSIRLGLGQLLRHLYRRLRPWPNVLELEIEGEVVEDQSGFSWLNRFLARPAIAFRELILTLRDAEKDPELSALILYLRPNSLGWSRAQELRQALLAFRASGKKTQAFLEEADTLDYFIASACEEVIFTPLGSLGLTGLISEVIYFKGVLDKLEIKPDLFQAGKYKSAVEPYTRSGMSRAQRESINSLLDSLYQQLVAAVAESRALSPARVRRAIDRGPYLAPAAREQGLVDYLLYEDQLDDHLEKQLGEPPRRTSLARYRLWIGPGLNWRDAWRSIPGLALVYASGVIHLGESRAYGRLGGESAGSDTLCQALREARDNPQVQAVVLRVDSPGGSGLASDLIWREVSLFQGKKPVVVSMGDVAASGGYYIAMPADQILAQPGTLTGSIGVIAGKINLHGLYHKIGLKKETVRRGQHADLHSDYIPFSESGRQKVKEEMASFYREFVSKAAAGRKQDVARMEKAAQGRVWTGEQAKELGLLDGFGGLRQALETAKRLAGIAEEEKALLYVLPRRRRLMPPLLSLFLPFSPRLSPALSELFSLESLADSRILALLPFRLRIR
ncbi:MAG: signal peptide peptidase SppA [Deltaproteobacteria bacterium RBG_13_61_14]|nr:MAG: signal peptide peptidase SppA [Deltaproteobacteria bacterium RBG_13_61_14]